jgi:hypothetical protein
MILFNKITALKCKRSEKNHSSEAMKCLTLLKIEAMERLLLYRFIALSLSTLYESMLKYPHNINNRVF